MQHPPAPPALLAPASDMRERFNLANPLEARLAALSDQGDWAGLCDQFDSLPLEVGFRFRGTWIEALGRAKRWEQLAQLCDGLLRNPALAQDPRRPAFLQQRARALSQLQRHPQALAAWEACGKAGDLTGFANACAEARAIPDWPALLRNAEALLALRASHAEALGWRGEALARLDRFTEAEPVLRAAVAADSRLAYAWNNLGRCALERKDWAEAKACLDRALTLDPGQLEALFNRGRVHFELRLYAASRDDFRAALALQPENPVITENLRQAERYAALPAPAPRKRRP